MLKRALFYFVIQLLTMSAVVVFLMFVYCSLSDFASHWTLKVAVNRTLTATGSQLSRKSQNTWVLMVGTIDFFLDGLYSLPLLVLETLSRLCHLKLCASTNGAVDILMIPHRISNIHQNTKFNNTLQSCRAQDFPTSRENFQ